MADRSALARATESTEAPTPGYLYIDIAKAASSTPQACRDTIQYLIRRLQNKNHNVKFKALKVITKTAEASRGGLFKREIQMSNDAMGAIKACLGYSGPPDPVRGDEIYSKVRVAAKDCLDMIYSDTPTSSNTDGFASGGGMSSMGGGGGISSSYGAPPSASSSTKRMEGIGNPMYKDPRLDQTKTIGNMTVGEVAKSVGETVVGMIRDPLARNADNSFGPPGSAELSTRTGGQWTMATNRGPSAIDPNRNYNREKDDTYYRAKETTSSAFKWAQGNTTASTGGVGGSWAAPTPPVSQPPAAARISYTQHVPPAGNIGAAASDGTYEKNLIMELCPPGGLKAEPPPDKLLSFSRSLPSLNSDLICPALLDCLEDGQPWMMKAKALCVMETAIKSSGGSNSYADFFHACVAEIEPLANHNRQAIRDPAKRVLRLLGVQVLPQQPAAPPPPPPPPTSQTPMQSQAVADLLDFGSDAPAPAPNPPSTEIAFAPNPPSTENALFGGLEIRSEVAQPPPPPVSQQQNEAADMFANLSMKQKDDPPPPQETQPPFEPSAQSGFAFLNNPEPTPPAPLPIPAPAAAIEAKPPLVDSFVSIPSPTSTPAPAAEPLNSNSSYNELLSLGTTSAQPQPPVPATFDPLLMSSPTKQMQQQPMVNPYYPYPPNYQMQMAMQMQMQRMMNMPQPTNLMNPTAAQNFMPSPNMGQHKNIMGGTGVRQIPVAFMDENTKKKEQQLKTFDFVKDAMKNAK